MSFTSTIMVYTWFTHSLRVWNHKLHITKSKCQLGKWWDKNLRWISCYQRKCKGNLFIHHHHHRHRHHLLHHHLLQNTTKLTKTFDSVITLSQCQFSLVIECWGFMINKVFPEAVANGIIGSCAWKGAVTQTKTQEPACRLNRQW